MYMGQWCSQVSLKFLFQIFFRRGCLLKKPGKNWKFPKQISEKYRVRPTGLSHLELLIVVAISSILMGVAYMGYNKYSRVIARLSALQQLGDEALQQMQNCLEMSIMNTGTEDFLNCNTKKKLSLQNCTECSSPVVSTTHPTLCMEMTKGPFTQCVAYRLSTAGWNVDMPFAVTVNHKVCVERYHMGAINVSAVWPYKPCSLNSDCSSGQICRQRLGKCDASLQSACK